MILATIFGLLGHSDHAQDCSGIAFARLDHAIENDAQVFCR